MKDITYLLQNENIPEKSIQYKYLMHFEDSQQWNEYVYRQIDDILCDAPDTTTLEIVNLILFGELSTRLDTNMKYLDAVLPSNTQLLLDL